MTVGEQIQAARKNAGMKQSELAEKIGVAVITIGQYERGKRQPRLDTLQRIATALDVSMDEILGIAPLPEKPVEFIDGRNKSHEILLPSEAQESNAFEKFLEELGFNPFIDITRFENPKGRDGDVWIIEDIRESKFYSATTEDLNKLMDIILSFSKFQIYELIKKLQPIEKEEIGNYKTPLQSPPCPQEGTDTTEAEKPLTDTPGGK